jgi:hypothetical protein
MFFQYLFTKHISSSACSLQHSFPNSSILSPVWKRPFLPLLWHYYYYYLTAVVLTPCGSSTVWRSNYNRHILYRISYILSSCNILNMHKPTQNWKFKFSVLARLLSSLVHPVTRSLYTGYSRSLFKLWLSKYELSHKMSLSVSSRDFVTQNLLNDDIQIFNNFISIDPMNFQSNCWFQKCLKMQQWTDV